MVAHVSPYGVVGRTIGVEEEGDTTTSARVCRALVCALLVAGMVPVRLRREAVVFRLTPIPHVDLPGPLGEFVVNFALYLAVVTALLYVVLAVRRR